MGYGKSIKTTEKNYLLNSKNSEMIDLYLKLRAISLETLENVTTAATADYISWSIDGGRQFANLYIQKKKIKILTLEPMREYSLGDNVPDTHLWTLNYQTDIFTDNDIEEVKEIIFESYDKLD